ncbi:hypothetical protein CDD83_5584 [Cordyceps sp. RAO-2017]|nr:hypothetical protein CDD83_5584 [Cordyceps sp. RAO-2017]
MALAVVVLWPVAAALLRLRDGQGGGANRGPPQTSSLQKPPCRRPSRRRFLQLHPRRFVFNIRRVQGQRRGNEQGPAPNIVFFFQTASAVVALPLLLPDDGRA